MLGDNDNTSAKANFDASGAFVEPAPETLALPVDDLPPKAEDCDATAEEAAFT